MLDLRKKSTRAKHGSDWTGASIVTAIVSQSSLYHRSPVHILRVVPAFVSRFLEACSSTYAPSALGTHVVCFHRKTSTVPLPRSPYITLGAQSRMLLRIALLLCLALLVLGADDYYKVRQTLF
jgi:hypothetical protein